MGMGSKNGHFERDVIMEWSNENLIRCEKSMKLPKKGVKSLI